MGKSKSSKKGELEMQQRMLEKNISNDKYLSKAINDEIMTDPYLNQKIVEAESKINNNKKIKSPIQKKHLEHKAGIDLLQDPEVVKRISEKLNKSPSLSQKLEKKVKQVKKKIKEKLSPKKTTPVMKPQSPEISKPKSSSSKKRTLKKNESKSSSSTSKSLVKQLNTFSLGLSPKSSSSTPKSSSSTPKSSSSTPKSSSSTPKSSSTSLSTSVSIIPQESIGKLKNLRDELEPKKSLDTNDVIKVEAVLKNEMGRIKDSCMRIQQQIKDNNIPNTEVNYSEKDKKCLIEGSYHVSDIFTFVKIKKMLNQEASRMRDKLFSSMGHGPLNLFNLMSYLRSNNGLSNHLFGNSMSFPLSSPTMSDSSMSSCSSDCPLKNSISPSNLFLSPYKIYKMPIGSMIGGNYLGRVNNCPNNGRLVNSTQGVIGCGNQLNQGGQQFIYPNKISSCKIGGKNKKSLKK